MKAINKVLAYSTSSLWLTITITLAIDYNLLENAIFWAVLIPMSLPVGMVLEPIYSFAYWCLSQFSKRLKVNLPHKVAYKRYQHYRDNYNNISNSNYLSDSRYQETLAENNVIRNLWMSSIVCLFCIIFFTFFKINNTISETKILIWLPISLPFIWLANFRTEILLKKIKGYYYFSELEKNKIQGVSYEFKNT